MIVDSSAVIAVMFQEPEYGEVLSKLEGATTKAIGAPTMAEAGLVLTARLQHNAIGLLARFAQELEIVTIPFGEDHWKETVDAFDRYGKGRHRASLNFGDCMTYAVAKLAREPLLCVGDDFKRTDLLIA
ncbi:MAG: type II toxin-antitoxin system VapC family toxin [Actinomycetota bacterium]